MENNLKHVKTFTDFVNESLEHKPYRIHLPENLSELPMEKFKSVISKAINKISKNTGLGIKFERSDAFTVTHLNNAKPMQAEIHALEFYFSKNLKGQLLLSEIHVGAPKNDSNDVDKIIRIQRDLIKYENYCNSLNKKRQENGKEKWLVWWIDSAGGDLQNSRWNSEAFGIEQYISNFYVKLTDSFHNYYSGSDFKQYEFSPLPSEIIEDLFELLPRESDITSGNFQPQV